MSDRHRDEGEVQRIVLTGSESTGKSTLARQLANLLEVPLVEEYARRYAERIGRPLTSDDVEPIARGQMAEEDRAIATARRLRDTPRVGRVVVLDTDLVSTLVYARHYYGGCAAWIAEEAMERRAALYLLCLPDLPWEADGVRDQPTQRQAIHAQFAERLRAIGATTVEVHGKGGERLSRALAAIRGWRAARTLERP